MIDTAMRRVVATIDIGEGAKAVAIGALDADGDGLLGHVDNCPEVANPDQGDSDADDQGDACDVDGDNDGIAGDVADNCPLDPNPDQADTDGDGAGDLCDADRDRDSVRDDVDLCVPTAGEVVDADGCAIAQLCPCDSAWKTHDAYVSCTAHATGDFLGLGLITVRELVRTVFEAGKSECGPRSREGPGSPKSGKPRR